MNIKTYQAIDMASALARVKEDLGPHAIILSTRKVKRADGAFGMIARTLVEVTAALDEDVAEDRQKRRKPASRVPKKQGAAEDAGAMASLLDPLRDELSAIKEMIGSSVAAGMAGSAELKKAATMADELESMRSMMGFLLENSSFYRGAGLDPNYLVCYRRMVERGVEPEYAMKLVREVKEQVPGGRELDLKSIIGLVMERIHEALVVGDPIAPLSDAPKVAALIGPTGVGKTTTVAKIAARLALAGHRVGLITIDTYRIAAVEQLKIYAGILNIPIQVALSPEDMASALKAFAEKDVILIDTAGRSQRDAQKLAELASFVGMDGNIDNYLVLSAAADPAAVDEAVRNFSRVPIAGLIFTKMDECAKPGVVMSQNFKTGIPVVYTTAGQRVPEDIEPATAAKLSARLFKKSLDLQAPMVPDAALAAAHEGAGA